MPWLSSRRRFDHLIEGAFVDALRSDSDGRDPVEKGSCFGYSALSQLASDKDEMIVKIAAAGGIGSILDAMRCLRLREGLQDSGQLKVLLW